MKRALSTAAPPTVNGWRAAPLTYSRALVRGLSPDFANAALRAAGGAVRIDQAAALAQHAGFVEALRRLVPDVVVLPAADGHPDSNFIEDTAVCIGNIALITRPGAPSRRGETAAVAHALASLGLRVVHTPEGATLDGGDVLNTGRELFVGLSERTNRAGFEAVRCAFPGMAVTPIALPGGPYDGSVRDRAPRRARSAARAAVDARVAARAASSAAAAAAAGSGKHAKAGAAEAAAALPPPRAAPHVHAPDGACCSGAAADDDAGFLGDETDGPLFHALHLKSLVSMAGPDLVLVADVEEGLAVAEALQARQKAHPRARPLSFLVVPDAHAANVLAANGHLLVPGGGGFPHSLALLRALGTPLIEVDMSELAKADGALTCGALLLH